MLTHDLDHRNQIIQELTRQVTDHQNMLIERTDALERLQSMVNSLPHHSLSPTPTTEIHNRIAYIQSLQTELDQSPAHHLDNFQSETRLYDKTTPSLELQTQDTPAQIQTPISIEKIHHKVDQAVDQAINAKKASLTPPQNQS